MSDLLSGTQWPAGLHIRRIGPFYVIFYGGKPVSVSFREEAAARCALDYWQAQMADGIIRAAEGTFTPPPTEWKLPSPQRLVEAVAAAAEAERVAPKARLAALEARLTANPLARPGWSATSLPNTLAGRVAAVLRQNYAADLPRKEIERKLKFGEDQFRFPERPDLGTFGLGTLKKALALSRK
jgi:hypothetical protein